MRDHDGGREAGRALAASEERYRLISEVISDYTFSTRLAGEGRLVLDWVAGAFEKITGYTYEEYVARGGWLVALHPDDLEQDARDMDTLRANRPVVSEVRTITKGGDTRWVRVYAHPVWDPDRNELVGMYGAVQDVTDRRKAEADRENLIRELEAKNAELERFTYTVSHDLKSPLITIRGFLTFVERDALEGNLDRLKGDISRIADAVGKMQRLLSELLELSRVGRVVNAPRLIPFGSLAREAESLVAGRIAARQVEVSIQDGLPSVFGDHDRLLEVVQNLLDNAVKFMGDQPWPRVEIGVRGDAGEQVFFVRDNGRGIGPAFREKVFGLFEKLDPDGEGTGVGLALVKRIVSLHGGRVWVEPGEAGRGSTFCFTLAGPHRAPATSADST
jgi:two-component system, chemotaxis family, sensor kinase Cph1